MDRFALEIVAEAEIAQHLEERVVIGGAADVVDVAGAQAFLAGGGPGEFELHLAQKMVLELVHPGRGEQHRRVSWAPARRSGGDAALGFEEFEERFAKFVVFSFDRDLSQVGIKNDRAFLCGPRRRQIRGACGWLCSATC